MIKISCPVRIDISAGWPDSDPYRKDFGGEVLNVAINKRVFAEFQGVNLVTSLGEVPQSSGLGTSGALRAAYIAASNPKLMEDKLDLIRRVHFFENQVLNQRAGFQDEAAAIYGGINYWEFGTNGSIKRNSMNNGFIEALEDRFVLIDTGASHLSANIHDLVFGAKNYEKNIPKLDRMKVLARKMRDSYGNFKILSECINESWELQKSLDKTIETEVMKNLQLNISGYSAVRATGAGGGGCMFFYTLKQNKEEIKNQIKRLQKTGKYPGVKLIEFEFEFEGIRIEDK